MSSGFLADLAINVIEKIGSKATSKFYQQFRNWPTSNSEIEQYYKSVKQSAEMDLKSSEDLIQRSLALLLKQRDLTLHDTVDRIRGRIQSLRHDIEKSSSDIHLSAVKTEDVLRALAMIYLTLQYEIFVVSNIASKLADTIEFGEDIKINVKELRESLNNLEETWRLHTQASADPASAKSLFNSLKESRKEWVELIETVSTRSLGEMNELMTGAVISKPKLFGKKQYQESLADLLWKFGEASEIKKIELPTLIANLRNDNPNAEFQEEDLEVALKLLVNTNRIFSIGVENNIKVVDFKRTESSNQCGNCGKHGGVYEEFRNCIFIKKLVCDDCISFFGKCKLCGTKIKENHPKI